MGEPLRLRPGVLCSIPAAVAEGRGQRRAVRAEGAALQPLWDPGCHPLLSAINYFDFPFNCSGGQSIETFPFSVAVAFLMQLQHLEKHSLLLVLSPAR